MSGIANWQAQIRIDIEDLKKRIKVAEGEINNFTNEERKVKLDIDTKTLESAIQKLDKMLDSIGKGSGDFKQLENLSKELSAITSEVKDFSKAFGKLDDSGAKTLLSSIQNIDKSLSDLSQHILNVNKNMGNMGNNTSGAVKQVENIGNAAADAVKQVDKLADAQSKLGNKTNISLGDSKEQSTEIDLYHNLEKRKVTYDEIIDKIQTIVSLKEKEKSLSKTSDDTKLYQNLYDKNDINWAGDTEGTINRISDRLKEIYTKYNGKISLIDENDIQEATYLLDILKGSGESPNLNKSQEKFYQNKKFSNDSLFDNIRVDSQKAEEIDKINTELSETYRWFNQLEGVSLNENIANEIKSLISDMQIGGKTASEYANDLLKIFNIEAGSNSAVKQQNKLQSELKETESQAEKTAQAVNESSSTTPEKDLKDAFPDKDVSASVESATNSIKEENNVLEQNTQKVKENTQAKEQNVNVNLNKYDKRLDSYNDKIDKYKTTIDRFNDGGWTSSTYLENVQAVKNAVKEYETLLNELKGKDASLVTSEDISKLDNYEKKIKDTIATVTNMSASEKGYNFVSGQKELDKIHKLLAENSKMSSEAKAKIRAYYAEIESGNPSMSLDKIHGEILKIYNAEVEAGRAGKTLWDTLKNSGFHQIAAQMAGMFGVYDVINGLKQVASTVRELDTAYTEMRKVSNESAQSLKNFQKESFSTADSVGTTALALQDATATWMRLGESLDEAKESAKDATVLLNVSEFENIDEATDSLVAMSQAYKELDKMEIIDVLDKIGNEYSISTNELSTALKDSAAVLKTQGNDLAESVALITAGNAITQDVSKTAGETLPERYRNIFYRTYLTARAA
jgi:DNA repair exonuclease SbcCD ATPase subunit